MTFRVLLQPDEGGRSASSHYRMIWPAEEALVRGVDVTVADIEDETTQLRGTTKMEDGFRPRVTQLDPVDYDVVVIQRPLESYRLDLIELLHEQDKKVIVELDDDFDCIPKGNVAHDNVEPSDTEFQRRWKNRLWLHHIVDAADLVICATPAIARRYGGPTPAVVVPNFIPEWWLSQEFEREWERPRIGLAQKLHTHPDDFLSVRDQVCAFLHAHPDVELHLLGANADGDVREALSDLDLWLFAEQVVAHPYCTLEEYPDQLAQVDVGIVPLTRCDFNDAKSALKGLEYAALGVPFIASGTEPYAALERSCGVGITCDLSWGLWLDKLFSSKYLHDQVAEMGRLKMRGLTIESNIDRWIDAWSSVCS